MPILRSVAKAEGASDPDVQFKYVYSLLEQAFTANPEFFTQPLYGSSVIRADAMRAELSKARDSYFNGDIHRQVVIRLLGALQAPAATHEPYDQANKALVQLYSLFYKRFGRSESTYEDIKRDARALGADPAAPKAVRHPMAGIYATTQAARAPIIDGRTQQLTGMQLQLTDDIYVNFALGNFGQEPGDNGAPDGISYVELLVAPPYDQLPPNPYK